MSNKNGIEYFRNKTIKKIDSAGKTVEESKLENIIKFEDDEHGSKDLWEQDGNVFIKQSGIYKIRDYTDATFGPPVVHEKSSEENRYGYRLHVVVGFPNGEESIGVGEADDKNTKQEISNNYKFTMAYKRARDRGLLHSKNVKLYEMYSESEKDTMVGDSNRNDKKATNDGKQTQKTRRTTVELMQVMPNDDKQYAGIEIREVFKTGEGRRYLVELFKDKSQPVKLRKTIGMLIKEKREENKKNKKPEEKIS